MPRLIAALLSLSVMAWTAEASGQVDPFEEAARAREAARQRAFERGQKTELPAREQREGMGRLDASSKGQAPRTLEGPPAADVYNRIMESARHFRYLWDPTLRNVNDSFSDDPQLRATMEREAQRLYPALLKPESDFAKRQAAINRWIDARNPPLARDARRMLIVAHMVSLELNGWLIPDEYGIGQIPQAGSARRMDGTRPRLAEQGQFEMEVRGSEATLPGGRRGSVTRGQNGAPDVIRWLDEEAGQSLILPQEATGVVVLPGAGLRRYQRLPGLSDSFRVRFSRP
ncbi:MAG: hypothetical protein LDL31_06840 [Prosthecobacter sp.]|nr:hypothetical protein [Prosthecobacter sp.]